MKGNWCPFVESLTRQVPREDILAPTHHCGFVSTLASGRYKHPLRAQPPHSLAGGSSGALSELSEVVFKFHSLRSGERKVEVDSVSCVGCQVQTYSPKSRILKHQEAGL